MFLPSERLQYLGKERQTEAIWYNRVFGARYSVEKGNPTWVARKD